VTHPVADPALVAILRGLEPGESEAIGDALFSAGFRTIEVPLNSPQPMRSIERLATRLPQCLVGAGTVVDAARVRDVHAAGGRLVVAPNFDAEVVAAALELGMVVMPGVATPTEAFAAMRAGATLLKVFPAEGVAPNVLRAWRSVVPREIGLFPVGGITPERMGDYLAAGADGFGLGSALYRPGDRPDVVGERALRFVAAWQALHGRFQA
jgi:2-dehydro-3-deoxyphosphogalactonate aldolase